MPHSTCTMARSRMPSSHTDTIRSQLLSEIMPMIYKRFTEKSAEEWRQIYKALQLMEFLVKNGSERVIDDARSHMSLLKMLKQFHYIDQNGKDQGLNVRNRSKELVDLLSDVDRIRQERKKSRTTRNKYTGVEGGAGSGIGGGSSGARYGGFGSESGGAGYEGSFGGASRGVYGDGGGFGGESHEEYDEGGRTGGADRFEEYNEFDDGGAQAQPGRRKGDAPRSSARTGVKKTTPTPKPKAPEVDLFEFGDDPIMPAAPLAAPANGNGSSSASGILTPPSSGMPGGDDDDFDDFQSASPSTQATVIAPMAAPLAAPAPPKPNYSSFSTAALSQAPTQPQQQGNFSNILSATSQTSSKAGTPSAFSPPAQPSGYQPTGPNYFTSVQIQPGQQQSVGTPGSGMTSPSAGLGAGAQAGKKPASGDAFASLLGGSGAKKAGGPAQKGLTLADMAKQKSQAGLYGANAAPMAASGFAASNPKPTSGGNGLDDLLG